MLTLDHAPAARPPLTYDEAQELTQLRQLVHHDLRTPLTTIIGFAELLLERDMTPEKSRQLIGFIAREGERITALWTRFRHHADRAPSPSGRGSG